MISTVFFDFDGVLTTDKYGSDTTNRYLGNATGLGFERVDRVMECYNGALLLGRLSHRDIWPNLCRELEADIDFALLDEAFRSTPMNEGVLALAWRLRGSFRLGIITDNKQDRMDCLRALHGLDGLFDPIVVSAAIGADKSDGEIFRHALALCGLRAGQCLFIDNSRRNLETAGRMGMATIFHDDEINDVERLSLALRQSLDAAFTA
ncbi:HAD-IA family hydrolase [Chromobacterium vaccinii]|uniref:HAD-IA family hydrolase n=1 Tax=Chromobacterium vaccinii TaxID=1108595 RepID=UPI000E1600C6|nr:HAD-IA family hydrolase [Chromobacterium vaccinii]SUX53767.1 dUMP phosphatase [Chromobacterium vaccinii]